MDPYPPFAMGSVRMRKAFYVAACIGVFAVGAYVWRVKNTGLSKMVDEEGDRAAASEFERSPVVVEVDDEKVLKEDIDWEYDVVTADVDDKETLTPIPNLGARYEEEMGTLRKALISSVIERKVLYHYVKRDRDFRFDDPSRYTACLTEWQASVRNQVRAVQLRGGKDRLKSRLCERSILDQYMKERLFSKVTVADADVVEYFKNHMNEFKRPERVIIRHILLGDEDEAKKVRNLVNPTNFGDVARAKSIAPEADKGGRLGPFAKGVMPSVFDVAFQMKRNDISDVLKSNYGYHLIMVLDKQAKQNPSLEDARPQIEATLRKVKEEEEYKNWVDLALASISVNVPKATW